MNPRNEIILTRESWNALNSRLLNFDADNQGKIGEYFRSIEQDIEVKYENGSVFVESANLNEDAILSSLLSSQAFSNEIQERTTHYNVQIDTLCSLSHYRDLRKGYAYQDMYLTQLQDANFGFNFFTTAEMDKNTNSAA